MRRVVLAVACLAAAVACGGKAGAPNPASPGPSGFPAAPEGLPGVLDIPVGSAKHVNGQVSYPTAPPAGGDHQAVWQNCGFYSAVIIDEAAVHSLEHGAVWITYRTDIDSATKSKLTALAESGTHVLVSPYPSNPTLIVVTAWGRQLRLEAFDDAQVARFVATYAKSGPTVPEPGAPCRGGVGTPPDRPNR